MKPVVYQLNLSRGLGGAEFYTYSFTHALAQAGWPTRVIVHRDARFWDEFDFGPVHVDRADAEAVPGLVPSGAMLVIHGSTPEAILRRLAADRALVGLAHHALSEHNRFRYYDLAHWLIPVSRNVIDTLDRHGLDRYDPEPLYGVADVSRGDAGACLVPRLPYEWDARKGRDRLMAYVQPAFAWLRRPPEPVRRPGLALGIVSRISDAKQFPALFDAIAPAIARRADVGIEIFGSGLYQKVRALERALAPIRRQARFWGWQANVAAAFTRFDYLLPGVPEREALGLNVIEAQACGVPALGVAARPFTETIIDGRTGYLYRDPREDGAAEFAAVLDRLRGGAPRPDPRDERRHLARFGPAAFAGRVDAAMRRAAAELGIEAGAPSA
jgi:glycosyltransferase involved in cell wall biosynthesis